MTATPRTTGRHRAARRHRWVWPVTLALVVAVGTALLGTGGTYALWNGTASTAATTVRSATATVSVSSTTAMNTAVLGPGTEHHRHLHGAEHRVGPAVDARHDDGLEVVRRGGDR